MQWKTTEFEIATGFRILLPFFRWTQARHGIQNTSLACARQVAREYGETNQKWGLTWQRRVFVRPQFWPSFI